MTSPRDTGIRRLGALFRRSREAVFLLDADRRLAFVNPAWEALTGRPAEDVLGLECRPYGPNRDGDLDGLGGSFCPPPEALAGQPAGGPTLIVLPGGERRWCRVEYWPYHDDHGQPLGLLGLVRPHDAPPHAPESPTQRLRADLIELRERLRARHGVDTLVGDGPGQRRLLDQVAAAASSEVPVLIVGEPGTGRRTVARAIHRRGTRPDAPLVPIDCAALPPEALARVLFGGETEPDGDGATAPPRLVLADGSTLLLADALELPRDLQVRLASSLGGGVRLLAITAADPDQARRDDRLRPDLYYALTTLVIRLAPLRERLDELPLLALALLDRANARGDRRRQGFTPEASEALAGYDWPGNLRELGRVIDAAHGRGDGDLIGVDDLPAAIRGHLGAAHNPPPMPPPVTPLDDWMERLERHLIEQALQRSRHNKSRAADLLAISRPRLYRRIKELGLPDEPEPAEEPAHPGPG